MTPIAIALFILGLAIGFLISNVTVAKRMDKSLNRVFEQELNTYKFVNEYNHYTSKIIGALKQSVDILIDNIQGKSDTHDVLGGDANEYRNP